MILLFYRYVVGGIVMKNTIFRILKISFNCNRKLMTSLLLLNWLTIIISVVSLLISQEIINNIQLSKVSTRILYLFIVYVIVNLTSELITYFNGIYSSKYSDELSYEFSKQILNKINEFELINFENSDTYDLMQRAENASGNLPFTIISSLISASSQVFSIAIYLYLLFSWKWWSLIILLVFPLVSIFSVMKTSKEEYKMFYHRTKKERQSWYFAHLLNKDENIKETRLFGLENMFFENFKSLREKFIEENFKMNKKKSKYQLISSVLSVISTMGLIGYVFLETLLRRLLIGNMMTIINSINTIRRSITSLISIIVQIHSNSLYAKDIVDLLDFSITDNIDCIKTITNKISINKIDTIELKNISFTYPRKEEPALKNINLLLNKKNNTLIVGKNGSGKSTLIKLILGFYDTYTGEILVNGINLKNIDITSYRKLLTAGFQDYSKYQFTVKNSIQISNTSLKNMDAKYTLKKCIEQTSLNETIERLPQKLNQQLGNWFENGVQLSGGEWQKIALARTFYRDNAELVVFDEPNSSLDIITEGKIYNAFTDFTMNKIGIFISHKFNFTFKGRVIVLEKGTIIENDTHDNLIHKEGLYKEFVTIKKEVGV